MHTHTVQSIDWDSFRLRFGLVLVLVLLWFDRWQRDATGQIQLEWLLRLHCARTLGTAHSLCCSGLGLLKLATTPHKVAGSRQQAAVASCSCLHNSHIIILQFIIALPDIISHLCGPAAGVLRTHTHTHTNTHRDMCKYTFIVSE